MNSLEDYLLVIKGDLLVIKDYLLVKVFFKTTIQSMLEALFHIPITNLISNFIKNMRMREKNKCHKCCITSLLCGAVAPQS